MNLVVRVVYIVSLAIVLFHQNGDSLHIGRTKITYGNDGDINEDLLPIEHESETSKLEGLENLHFAENKDVKNLNEVSNTELETEEEISIDSSTYKNRVVRQANGNLYPQLRTPYNGNQQYYPTPGQGIPPNNSTWNHNSHRNISSPYNPLANITFNQYPSPSYPQNGYYNNPGGSPYNNPGSPYNNPGSPYNNPGSPYNNPGSAYHSPQGQAHNQFNASRPGQQYPYGSSSPRYPTYPQNPYASKNNFNVSRNSSSQYGNPGLSYGTHNAGYPTPSPFNTASPRPVYPYAQNNLTQWQGNVNRNNTYGYNNYTGSQPGQHNPYPNTSPPMYPQGQYPTNTNNNYPLSRNGSYYNGGPGQTYGNYNPMYPSPPPFHAPNPRPVNPYGQSNSSYNSHWNSNSYGNQTRPNIVNGFNNSNPYGYNNNYNPNNYPNSNSDPLHAYIHPNYPTPATNTNGSLRPTYGGYPTPQNNGQGANNWNPVQPYNSNPYENPNLFNYPLKNNATNPNNMYDPRRNPPHNFSY